MFLSSNKIKPGYIVLLLIQLCQCTEKANQHLEVTKNKKIDIYSLNDTNSVNQELISLIGISMYQVSQTRFVIRKVPDIWQPRFFSLGTSPWRTSRVLRYSKI